MSESPESANTATRRSVLIGGLFAGLSLSLPDWDLLAAMTHHAKPDTATGGPSVLGAADRDDLVAITARIIPTDTTPGAREAGAAEFIDRALSTFLSPIAEEFHAGLSSFQQGVSDRFQGMRFAALTESQQIEWLRSVEQSPFFVTVRQLTVLGMFSDPAYGGNRQGIGWKLLGFVDEHAFVPPFGYYDRDYPGFDSRTPAP